MPAEDVRLNPMSIDLSDLQESLDVPAALQRIESDILQLIHEQHLTQLAVRRIERKVGIFMATQAEFDEQLNAIDASIADINQDNADALALLESLQAELANAGLDTAEEAALLQRITDLKGAIAAAEAATDALTPEETPPA